MEDALLHLLEASATTNLGKYTFPRRDTNYARHFVSLVSLLPKHPSKGGFVDFSFDAIGEGKKNVRWLPQYLYLAVEGGVA